MRQVELKLVDVYLMLALKLLNRMSKKLQHIPE